MAKVSKDLENLRHYVDSLKNSPMLVSEYLDSELPDRHTDELQFANATVALEALKQAELAGIIAIDKPVTEMSIIHGITRDGLQAIEMIRLYAATLGLK